MAKNNDTPQQYFISRVEFDPHTSCVVWKGTRLTTGYARFANNGNRNLLGHREAYKMFHGPIPEGTLVRHKCDNPSCVNPWHLELGTQKDNMRDRFERGNRGAIGRKISDQERVTLLALYQADVPIYKIAAQTGISTKTVRAVCVPSGTRNAFIRYRKK